MALTQAQKSLIEPAQQVSFSVSWRNNSSLINVKSKTREQHDNTDNSFGIG